MSQNYFSRLLRKNIWIYFFSFIIAPTGYIVKIVISNSVSVEELGTLYAVMSFMMILGSYNDFGMSESLNYFLPEHVHNKNAKKITSTVSIALATQLSSTLLLTIVLFFSASWLGTHYFETVYARTILQILVLQFFSENIFRTINTFFQAIQDTKAQKGMDFFRMLVLMVMVLGLWFVDLHDIAYFAWAWSLSVLVAVIASLLVVYIKYSHYFTFSGWRFSKIEYRHVFSYAFWAMLSTNVGMLLSQIDMQMVTTMLGVREAGYYTNYLSLIRIPFLFLLPGVYFLFPVFSDLLKRGEGEKVVTIHAFCYEFFAIIALMMTSFFMLFGDVLTYALFGSGYEVSGSILLYSAPFLLFNFLLQIDFQILSASGRPRTKMYILLAGVVVNVITNYIFLKLWGVEGSAFASGIGWIFIWILSFYQTRQYASTFRWLLFVKNCIGIGILSYCLSRVHLDDLLVGRGHIFLGILGVLALYGVVFMILNWSEFRRFQRIFRAKHIVG